MDGHFGKKGRRRWLLVPEDTSRHALAAKLCYLAWLAAPANESVKVCKPYLIVLQCLSHPLHVPSFHAFEPPTREFFTLSMDFSLRDK